MRRLLPRLLLALQLLGVADLAPPPAREAHRCCCSGAAAVACAGACECACGAPMPRAGVRTADPSRTAGDCELVRGRCGRPAAGVAPTTREPFERPLAPRPRPGRTTARVVHHTAPRPAHVTPQPPSPPPRG